MLKDQNIYIYNNKPLQPKGKLDITKNNEALHVCLSLYWPRQMKSQSFIESTTCNKLQGTHKDSKNTYMIKFNVMQHIFKDWLLHKASGIQKYKSKWQKERWKKMLQ